MASPEQYLESDDDDEFDAFPVEDLDAAGDESRSVGQYPPLGSDRPAVSGMGPGDFAGDAAVQADEGLGSLDLWHLVDASGLGSRWEDPALAVVADQTDRESPSRRAAELAFAAQAHLPKPRKARRRRRIGIYLPTFSEDDFEEGAQREAFVYLRDNVRACYLRRGVEDWERRLALNWVFLGEESLPFSFELCCRVLDADPQNVRARLQYEFRLRGYILSEPFDLLCAPLPESIANLSAYGAGPIGTRVAASIWRWPGVSMRNLSAFLSAEQQPLTDGQLLSTVERLDACGAIEDYGTDAWYATGRGQWSDA